jgi:hypothetical protein
MRVVVAEHVSDVSLVRVRRLEPPGRAAFAVDTGAGGEALARALCQDLLGTRRVALDPGLYLEFLFAGVAQLDAQAWVLSEAQIRALTIDPLSQALPIRRRSRRLLASVVLAECRSR